MRCAVIKETKIVNIILADPAMDSVEGCSLVEIHNGALVNIGWLYVDGEFTNPNADVPELYPEPVEEE